jgi:hypothetical protein
MTSMRIGIQDRENTENRGKPLLVIASVVEQSRSESLKANATGSLGFARDDWVSGLNLRDKIKLLDDLERRPLTVTRG